MNSKIAEYLKKSKQNTAFEILKSHLMLIVDSIPDDDNLTNIRDRALMLFGWYSCCRRSEILSLTVEDLDKKINPDGHIIVKIPYSKKTIVVRRNGMTVLWEPTTTI